jgi:hypothetical protein
MANIPTEVLLTLDRAGWRGADGARGCCGGMG